MRKLLHALSGDTLRPIGPVGQAGAGVQSVRVFRAEDPLAYGQQLGKQVSGGGRIPGLACEVGEVAAGGQGARVLRAEDPLLHNRLCRIPRNGFWGAGAAEMRPGYPTVVARREGGFGALVPSPRQCPPRAGTQRAAS